MRSWNSEKKPVVIATVASSSDSAPRGLGAQLAVTSGDLWTGGLTGGCAEAAVLGEARRLLSDDNEQAAVLITMTKDEMGSVGPVCGATLEVLVERVDGLLLSHLETATGNLLQGATVRIGRRYAIGDENTLVRVSCNSETAASSPRMPTCTWLNNELWETIPPAPRLVIGGAGDVAVELIRVARQLGWRTVLVDPRKQFVDRTVACEEPDVVMTDWPADALAALDIDERTTCVATAHDEKLDTPFLIAALHSHAFYVGSIGSRVVQHERSKHLAESLDDAIIAKHHGPAGLNLGGSTAAEIALSIAAEITATWYGRSGSALRDSTDSIRAHV